ncbi:DegV family protein [Lacicoccus qingdaonensis]|uniref:EDD domain protein, DegV family n=1 Tax=Lacicoccus qingdaonensis TaxID=576118 RepID=A0A1G9ED01_9BACL|nr:DegV family protein [Salinicoccus qingdaonensis]SDK73958.1 EDD domain protein, DegV family [Salinicoccus qingdaonensis]
MILFADSCADIPLEDSKRRGIEILPLTINIGDNNYKDQIDISSEEVLQAITDGERPKTSQINPENFVESFKPFLEKGESILYIAFSSELSGTYQSALIARDTLLDDYPEADITIIDTHAASYGLGMIVESASDDMKNGLSDEEVIKNAEKNVKNIRHFFTVNDLDYLAKGGRLSKGSAFLGGLLNIKPLLHVEDGKLVPLEKHRGIKKVFKSMIKHINDDQITGKIHITQSNALDSAELLKKKILEETEVKVVNISMIGPTISSHTGNGTIAMFYFNEGV